MASLLAPVINFSFGDIHGGGIDLEISSPTENFVPSETAFNMRPGDSVSREIKIYNNGTNPFYYYLRVEKTSGDDDFCNTLQMEITLEKEELIPAGTEFVVPSYCNLIEPTLIECREEGPAPNFNPPIFGECYPPGEEPPEASEPRLITERIHAYNLGLMDINFGIGSLSISDENRFFFNIILPKNAPGTLQNKTCQFKFVFTASQILSGPEEPNSTSTEPTSDDENNVGVLYFSDTEETTNILKSGQWIKPDFWIETIKPVQVVWEPDINGGGKIDLVAGKSTMVRVKIGMKDYEALPKQEIIEVELTFDGKSYFATSTINQLEENNKGLDIYPDPPVILGDQIITAMVDPADKIKEADENYNAISTKVTVKDTSKFYLTYFRVIDSDGSVPSESSYRTMVNMSGEFILGTYPVSNSKFINEGGSISVSTLPLCPLTNDLCQKDVLFTLWLNGKIASLGQTNVSIGIVPEGSLGFHEHGVAPVLGTKPILGAVLAEEKWWTIPAHEVGHTQGLWTDPNREEYDVYNESAGYPNGKPASGFWVDKNIEMNDSYCFMSHWSWYPKENWDWWISNARYIVDTWICNDCYENLFRKLRINKKDPEVLLVGGFLSKEGIQPAKWYRLPEGLIDEGEENGNYSINLFDSEGKLINQFIFSVVEGTLENSSMPFGFVIPYPISAYNIKILHNNETLFEVDPRIKLLHDAVNSIPDSGFINNPQQRREALHHKIDAIEKMLDQNNIQGAISKLEHDLKDILEKWLVNGYQKENLIQYSKNEILELVKETINRISLQ